MFRNGNILFEKSGPGTGNHQDGGNDCEEQFQSVDFCKNNRWYREVILKDIQYLFLCLFQFIFHHDHTFLD